MSDVHVGKDGWLFLVGGNNNVLSLYTDKHQFSSDDARSWCDEIKRRFAIAEDVGAKYLHLVAPEKLKIYRDRATLFLPRTLESPAAEVKGLLEADRADPAILDLTATLLANASQTQLYMKTDTHWTYEGIQVVYRAICDRLGITPSSQADERDVIRYKSVFDLGGKLNPPIEEANIHVPFLPGIRRVYANKIAEMWDDAAANNTPVRIHNSLHVVYENTRPGALNQKVMLFGDSFMDFRPTTLSSLFIEQFRETHIVWSTSMDDDYVLQQRPDILITENAERFMKTVPSRHYKIERDAKERIDALNTPT